MKKNFINTFIVLSFSTLAIFAASCSSDDDESPKDMEKPAIVEQETTMPTDCQVYHRGETLPVRLLFTDNIELGAYNIEIHNDFERHSHSTSEHECEHEEEKEAVNPWVFNQDYSIPTSSRSYSAEVDISIPTDIDTGDYHFMVRLTDKAGWQQLKAIAIKIAE